MISMRLGCLSLVAALAVLPRTEATGQALPPCPWDRCALREHYGLFSYRLVEGRQERRVASLGFLVGDVPLFGERSDSAASYFASFRNRVNSGNLMGLVSAALFLTAALTWDDNEDLAVGLTAGGLAVGIGGTIQVARARNQLSRAVWHYNATLERSP